MKVAIAFAFIGVIIYFFYFKKESNIDSLNLKTKEILEDIAKKRYDKFNFKELKKENHPLASSLKKLNDRMQSQDLIIKKRTKKLYAKNITNQKIISNISHEIKNPLNIIHTSIQTMLKTQDLNLEIREKLLNRSLKYSKTIISILDKLSLSASLDNKLTNLELIEFDLKKMCLESIDGFQEYAHNLGKNILFQGQERVILADKILFEQVIINILHNAIKYANKKIIVRVKKDFIEICDDGPGVSGENLKNLGKKFFKTKDSLKGENSLGLGIFITHEIIKIHNFRIEFISKKGLKVRIYFIAKKR